MDSQGGKSLFSDVWSENAALFKRFLKIHANLPILYYVMALNFVFKNIHTDPWQAILTEESQTLSDFCVF